ncbi:MAG: FKBP-type peptidyl-prolyl cis-trans isomerase [Niabella sp.]
MKRVQILGAIVFATLAFTACKNADYKTSPNGLKYKIFQGDSKDSTKEGYVLKMNMVVNLSGSKDSVLADTHGKMPFFAPIQATQAGQPLYDPSEVFKQLRKGDSMVAVIYIDSAIKKGLVQEAMLPPFLKKGDKLTYHYKVLEVFKVDSLARADYQKEMAKDAPRQQKEQEEMMAKAKAEQEAKQKVELDSLKKSGGIEKLNKEVADYLTQKGITGYVTTPLGAFVKIDNPGTGTQVADSKFVTVKYNGKHLSNDSSFQSSAITTQINGPMGSIKGFEDGLKQFKEGGKGTIYIPGYLAYGSTPPPGSPFKRFEPLYFEVEIQKVADTEAAAAPAPAPQAPRPAANKATGHAH